MEKDINTSIMQEALKRQISQIENKNAYLTNLIQENGCEIERIQKAIDLIGGVKSGAKSSTRL
jgi:hypothetical protein